MTKDQRTGELLVRAQRYATGAVWRIVGRHGGQTAVEETLQEASLKAWKYRRAFRGQAAYNTWFMRIAVNEALMRLRRNKKKEGREAPLAEQAAVVDEGLLPELPWTDQGLDPERLALREEAHGLVRRALRHLNPANRATVAARHLGEMQVSEVARALGVSASTVKSRTRRSLREMREELRRAS